MKNRRKWLVVAGLAFLVLAIFLLWPKASLHNEKEPTTTQAQSERRELLPSGQKSKAALNSPEFFHEQAKRNEEGLTKALKTPIDFFGIVVDQHDQPVPGAQVVYSIVSTLDFVNPKQQTGEVSGADGRFSVLRRQGASIFVKVSHPDYLFSPSAQKTFSFYENPNAVEKEQLPSREQPAVFRLIKKGDAEPLLKQKQVLRNVPKNGQAVGVGLSGKKSGDATIQAWTSPRPTGAANNAPFDWKVRVEVPGGGLVAYEDAYQFEAPQDGYAPSVEFAMPVGGIDGKWRDRFEETYFVKLANGNYARMRFQMIAGGAHFAVVESYYNPSGSRNLEYDPAKTVSVNP